MFEVAIAETDLFHPALGWWLVINAPCLHDDHGTSSTTALVIEPATPEQLTAKLFAEHYGPALHQADIH